MQKKYQIPQFNALATYVGDIHKVRDPSLGDIGIDSVTKEMKCWTGTSWMKLGDSFEGREEKNIKMKPKICERCGGSFKGMKCGWCDAEYEWTA